MVAMKIEKLNLSDLATSREELTTTEHRPQPGYRIVTPTEQKSFIVNPLLFFNVYGLISLIRFVYY